VHFACMRLLTYCDFSKSRKFFRDREQWGTPLAQLPTKQKRDPMLARDITRVAEQLEEAIGGRVLDDLGTASGFVVRARTITAPRFVTSLLSSLGTRRIESIADIQRDFNQDHGTMVFYKPFYEKLDRPQFPALMQGVFESLLCEAVIEVLAPLKDGPFARFEDILVQDGTSFALRDGLQSAFPGRFTTVSPAAVELHVLMSLMRDNIVSVSISPDSESERHFLPPPEALRNKLILADRGYDGTNYLQQVDDAGGSFLVRIRKTHNPRIVRIYHRGARYRHLEGHRLNDVLRRLPKDKAIDLDVCWEASGGELRCFSRLVLCWNPSKKEWVRLLSNLHRDDFTAKAIQRAYRLRWQIELFNKELKSYANLHKFQTCKPHIAEGLIWASLAAVFLKRFIAHACERVWGAVAISTRRVAMCGHAFVRDVCTTLLTQAATLQLVLRRTFAFLAANAQRTNRRREKTRGRLALGLRLIALNA
jgi:Transposase DDE domain